MRNMRVHYIKPEPKEPLSPTARATLAGAPILDKGQKWPECRLCKAQMIFFFQLDIEKKSDLPLKSGSHLLVFMCPTHNDSPADLLEPGETDLPENYWDRGYGHYKLILNKSPKNEVKLTQDKLLSPVAVKFTSNDEEIDWDGKTERGTAGFKLGGVPNWEQEAQAPRCSCSSDMVFFCQVPARFPFPKRKNTPVQPDAVSPDTYSLFNGKSVYLFACTDQCTPYSVYAITQDITDDQAQSA